MRHIYLMTIGCRPKPDQGFFAGAVEVNAHCPRSATTIYLVAVDRTPNLPIERWTFYQCAESWTFLQKFALSVLETLFKDYV